MCFPIDRATQRFEPAVLRSIILRLWNYSLLAGYSGEHLRYDKMIQDFYLHLMENKDLAAVRDCRSCARNHLTNNKQWKLQLFSPSGHLAYLAMEIIGPSPKNKAGNLLIVVTTDRYSKLAKAIPTAITTATAFGTIFVDHRVYIFGILLTILTATVGDFCRTSFKPSASSFQKCRWRLRKSVKYYTRKRLHFLNIWLPKFLEIRTHT